MEAAEQALAAIGKAHAARQAVEQWHPQPAFQAANLVRHRRGRHRQFLGGSLEAGQARGGLEGAQGGEGQAGKHGKLHG
ncbi:hypothetical protein D9M73_253810 [compost metagenome]